MRNTNLLSDLLKTDLAGITLISEENWWQFFLHIAHRYLSNHKNGTFTDILKCIIWDFDKKSGYILFLLSRDNHLINQTLIRLSVKNLIVCSAQGLIMNTGYTCGD